MDLKDSEMSAIIGLENPMSTRIDESFPTAIRRALIFQDMGNNIMYRLIGYSSVFDNAVH